MLEDETICIVDEGSYLIVDVIRSSAQLALSAEQMHFIFANVPRDGTTNVRVHLGLGVEVPPDVELLAFPEDVLWHLPGMERYR